MPTESKGKLDRLNTATWEFQTNWKKWREAKFPPESKLHNAEEVKKRKMKIYKINSRGLGLGPRNRPELVYEKDLGEIKCFCGGKLNIEKKQISYGTQESILLKCEACKGRYGAISLTQKEREEFNK